MNSLLLHMYPARFRRAFGDEMAESYREATEGAGRLGRLRETSDVVAHALRLRLGIGSARPGGRLLAAATPFALAATAAYAAFYLIMTLSDMYAIGSPDGFLVAPMAASNLCSLLTFVGAVLALGGAHVTGSLCALAGTLGGAVAFFLPDGLPTGGPYYVFQVVVLQIAPVLVAAVPVACPPDLRPARRVRGATGLAAIVLWALLLVAAVVLIDPAGLGGRFAWRFGVPLAGALLLAGRPAFARIRTVGRFACAAAPLLVCGYCAGVVRGEELAPVLGALAVTAVALRLFRRRDRASGTANRA